MKVAFLVSAWASIEHPLELKTKNSRKGQVKMRKKLTMEKVFSSITLSYY